MEGFVETGKVYKEQPQPGLPNPAFFFPRMSEYPEIPLASLETVSYTNFTLPTTP